MRGLLIAVLISSILMWGALTPWTVTITNPPQIGESRAEAAPLTLQDKATFYAEKWGIGTTSFFNMIESESSWNPAATSSTGDYGLAQLNLKNPPLGPVTAQDALDPDFSLNYAAEAFSEGLAYRWTSCNCFSYIKTIYPNFPAQDTLAPNSGPRIGAVVLMNYDGIPHYAYITAVSGDYFTVREANLTPCVLDTRQVSWTDKHIQGYWHP